ncbi:HutD family protein [Streptomyces sp. NPDC007088]|uniref:HutD/Ves family protein n=1 Tax=Streptomyces sp. NPDC007088 TaxID=3364773 RepID=UPI003674F884
MIKEEGGGGRMGEGEVLRWSDYRVMPWKNGGGTTREVASGSVRAGSAPAPSAPVPPADGFDWRVSVADVDAGGPFSAFPGVDRVITLVEGSGMVLTVDGTSRPVGPLSPFAFPGDAVTDCRLEAGPVRDMNVMTRRDRASADVRVVRVTDGDGDGDGDGTELTRAEDEVLLVMATTEGLVLGAADKRGDGDRDTGEDATTLGRLDCVRVGHAGPGSVFLRGEGTAAVIRVVARR